MTVDIASLKLSPYFSGLSDSTLNTLTRYVFEKKADRGEILIYEGEPAEALFFVISGVVKVFKTSADGKEQIFGIIRPGETFNDVPVLSGGKNLISAEAMSNALLNGIRKKDMETIIRENTQVALNVVHVLSRRVQELVSMVEDFSFRHVSSRVAKIILEYALDVSDGRPRLTQQEMAAMIGTAREMVGRSLKSLEREGAIRMERNRIIVTNQQALREMAGIS